MIVLVLEAWFLREPTRAGAGAAAWLVVGILYASSLRRRGIGELRESLRVGPPAPWIEAAAATSAVMLLAAVWFLAAAEPYDVLRFDAFQQPPYDVASHVLQRLARATFQQLVLLTFVWPLLCEVFGTKRLATAIAGILFGVLHLPSLGYAALAAGCAWMWVILYRRGRRIFPLILSHAVIAAVASVVVPPRVHYDMNVGSEAARLAPRYRMLASEQGREILRVVTSDDYYQSQGGTDRDWITALYRDILGRKPAAWEVDFWLHWKVSRSNQRVARHFIMSDELLSLQESYGDEYRFPFRREQ